MTYKLTWGAPAFAFRLLLMIDIGLLLFRAAGFLLALTFGVQKIGWYVTAFHSGKPLSSIGLTPLIAHMGLPLPVILALWITLNESIGAFFVGIGLFSRFAAASLALGMIGAVYTSIPGRSESSALFHHLPRSDLHRRWQVLDRLLTAILKVKTAARVGVLIDLRHFTLIIRSAPCLRQLPWLRCRLPARLKLVRFPAPSPLPTAALPSMSLSPKAPFPRSGRVLCC